MTLQELQQRIQEKQFRSTTGVTYKFIGGTTLQVDNQMALSAHYKIYDENGTFVLDHGDLIPAKNREHLKIIFNREEDPMEFYLEGKITGEFHGTWKEIIDNE